MIRAIHHRTVPIRSQIRNAVIDFSQMTASAVAIVTDVERGGEPVVGFGFSSNGRYSQEGILREDVKIGNRWVDHTVWGLLSNEWKVERERYAAQAWM